MAWSPVDRVFEIDPLQSLVEHHPLDDGNAAEVAGDAHDSLRGLVLFEFDRGDHVDDGPTGSRLAAQGISAALFGGRDLNVSRHRSVEFFVENLNPAGRPIYADLVVFVLDHVGPEDPPGILHVKIAIQLELASSGEGIGL